MENEREGERKREREGDKQRKRESELEIFMNKMPKSLHIITPAFLTSLSNYC